jgi:predicted ATPase
MLKQLNIDNFKSLVGFQMKFEKFACLIGVNGVGKSTILQALDFIAAIMRGEVEQWLDDRQWDAKDINSKLSNKSNIELSVIIELNNKIYEWDAHFNRVSLSCTKETIFQIDLEHYLSSGKFATVKETDLLFTLKNGKYRILSHVNVTHNGKLVTHKGKQVTYFDKSYHNISFNYKGSILSVLKDSELGEELVAIRDYLGTIHSLDLLSPYLIRQQSRKEDSNVNIGGEKVATFIHQLPLENKRKLIHALKKYYPQVNEINTKQLSTGIIELEIVECFNQDDSSPNSTLVTGVRHINDGLLRLLTILSQEYNRNDFILFDEIENGVNPEITEDLVDALVSSPKQILVTTHSPMMLNYLEDEQAKKSVVFIYKNKSGITRAIPFFNIPSMMEKLKVMGPGEVFVDTELSKLEDEIQMLSLE